MSDELPPVGTVGESHGWLRGPSLQGIHEATLRGNAMHMMGAVHNITWVIDHLKVMRSAAKDPRGEAIISACIKLLDAELLRAADEAAGTWTKYKELSDAKQ